MYRGGGGQIKPCAEISEKCLCYHSNNIALITKIYLCLIDRERQRQRETETERETEAEKERQRHKESQRQKEKEKENIYIVNKWEKKQGGLYE